jgi:hypothetical protein
MMKGVTFYQDNIVIAQAATATSRDGFRLRLSISWKSIIASIKGQGGHLELLGVIRKQFNLL